MRCRRSVLQTLLAATAGPLVALGQKAHAMTSTTDDDRFSRGLALLRRIGGEKFDEPIKRLAETSPDLSRFTVEYPYGDVLSRPGLELQLRQLCTVSMLLADGNAQPQLKFHMTGFLNAGGKPEALVELLFVSVALLGFPPTINAIGIVRAVFTERKLHFTPLPPSADDGSARGRTGIETLERIAGGNVQAYFDAFAAGSPALARLSIAFAYGEMLSRDGLAPKAKLLAIVSMLAAAGNRAAALRLHLEGALARGVTQQEIIEVLIQISVYKGFPSALNAFAVAREVFAAPAPTTKAGIDASGETESRDERFERGRATLAKTSGAAGDAVVHSFDDIAPDLGRMIVEHSYGEIFSRPGIDLKTRELSACAALAAVGSAATETPLRVHINAALNVGVNREEILETLLNLSPYCGFPATQQAVRIAAEEFAKRS